MQKLQDPITKLLERIGPLSNEASNHLLDIKISLKKKDDATACLRSYFHLRELCAGISKNSSIDLDLYTALDHLRFKVTSEICVCFIQPKTGESENYYMELGYRNFSEFIENLVRYYSRYTEFETAEDTLMFCFKFSSEVTEVANNMETAMETV